MLRLKSLNLHQRGQFLCSVRVPQVDPPARATEGGGGEQRPVGWEVTGRQEVDGLMCPSCQVPHECIRAQTPQTHHLMKEWRVNESEALSYSQCMSTGLAGTRSEPFKVPLGFLRVWYCTMLSWKQVKVAVWQRWEKLQQPQSTENKLLNFLSEQQMKITRSLHSWKDTLTIKLCTGRKCFISSVMCLTQSEPSNFQNYWPWKGNAALYNRKNRTVTRSL